METFPQFLPVLGVLILLLISAYKRSSTRKSIKLAPEPPGALPLIGHLHFLRGQAPVAKILGKIADDYGPVYSLRLGSRQALVVSSWEMVKDCFTTNDRNFATRPDTATSRHMVYNDAGFALAPYGPYWREIRKLVTSELFTSQRLEKYKNVRNLEIKSFITHLFSLSTLKNGDQMSTVNMGKWFEQVTFNVTIQILARKRFSYGCRIEGDDEDSHVHEAIKKGLYLSGIFVASDFFPILEWMDIGGHLNAMKEVAKEVDIVIEKWLKEHAMKRNENDGRKEEEDFMDVMLSTLSKDSEMHGHRRETVIKATIMILMLTGSESTALTLTWALSLLLNNPHVLRAAQEELDIHVGREKWVEESDIKNLPYLQAIMKETLRMYPPGPLAGPHEAIEDCNIGGYHVSKGTRLIVNVWKLHRDPQVWSDPHEFRPERFLEQHSNINYQGQNYEYIPFSSGRRMCPAITFAFQVVHLTLARLLQGFDLSTPMGKPVDMSEGLGIALPKVKPLEVIITPRISPNLYD
ncbi:cytochrome P450 82C2-like [Cynara cardunculus var. scolymus]|uniref:cytochrome P450 82C2-like n=1 Tax=Cynara cardunculus var. scolymus TaxID=59895 RepID=UPI000D62D84D|nr:cytochrome P450 82C2-like [Cynara cardunculus var. scolymus]